MPNPRDIRSKSKKLLLRYGEHIHPTNTKRTTKPSVPGGIVYTYGYSDDIRCSRCRRRILKGDKYTLSTPRGHTRSERRHYPRCPTRTERP